MTNEDNEYELVIARRFLKDMRKLDREDQARVRRALSNIQTGPYRGERSLRRKPDNTVGELVTCEFVMTLKVGKYTFYASSNEREHTDNLMAFIPNLRLAWSFSDLGLRRSTVFRDSRQLLELSCTLR